MTPVLRTRGLSVGYAHRRGAPHVVLSDLDLAAERGRLTCLLGPNGSGKSTLLRTVAGMQDPLAGTVELGGEALRRLSGRERARRLAVVLTDQVDAGHLRAVDLVALGRHPHTGWDGRLRPVDHEAVRWALDAVRAGPLAGRDVAELSDGERQRVLVARALAQQPRLLALDEPIAFVDVARRMELTGLLRDLAHECDLGVLLTTHDLDLALRTADTVWLIEPLADGSGRLHVGAPEDLVLSGAVGRAFASATVGFDAASGTFRPSSPALGAVRVIGEGLGATWVARALEREGLVVDPAADELVVTVLGDGRWSVAGAGEVSAHSTAGAAARCARALVPRLAGVPPHGAAPEMGRR